MFSATHSTTSTAAAAIPKRPEIARRDGTQYVPIASTRILERIKAYKARVASGGIKPGQAVTEALESKGMTSDDLITLPAEDVLNLFTETLPPVLFAEGDEKLFNWSREEQEILACISVATPVNMYGNGSYGRQQLHETPIRGYLIYSNGALLGHLTRNTASMPDRDRVVEGGSFAEALGGASTRINQAAYNDLYVERFGPVMIFANALGECANKNTHIAIPTLGGGVFSGEFREQLAHPFTDALVHVAKTILESKHISAVRHIPYGEYEQSEIISANGIKIEVHDITHAEESQRLPQLCHPGDYGHPNSIAIAVVAGDLVSQKGNDHNGGTDKTNEGKLNSECDAAQQNMGGTKGHWGMSRGDNPKPMYCTGCYADNGTELTYEEMALRDGIKFSVKNRMFLIDEKAGSIYWLRGDELIDHEFSYDELTPPPANPHDVTRTIVFKDPKQTIAAAAARFLFGGTSYARARAGFDLPLIGMNKASDGSIQFGFAFSQDKEDYVRRLAAYLKQHGFNSIKVNTVEVNDEQRIELSFNDKQELQRFIEHDNFLGVIGPLEKIFSEEGITYTPLKRDDSPTKRSRFSLARLASAASKHMSKSGDETATQAIPRNVHDGNIAGYLGSLPYLQETDYTGIEFFDFPSFPAAGLLGQLISGIPAELQVECVRGPLGLNDTGRPIEITLRRGAATDSLLCQLLATGRVAKIGAGSLGRQVRVVINDPDTLRLLRLEPVRHYHADKVAELLKSIDEELSKVNIVQDVLSDKGFALTLSADAWQVELFEKAATFLSSEITIETPESDSVTPVERGSVRVTIKAGTYLTAYVEPLAGSHTASPTND